ncbi:calcium-binding protein [Natrinema ejinorense]|uniref:Calcium-binding protein n=1 Tax=Natrinema ejinorense TaxID=373386 RepID=A0A2A5R0I8_9EURY|nr:calcium-binding protein [Natrinema ejinorense]PCR92606.1 calcium-binding protein [Natrinema ejinorense]
MTGDTDERFDDSRHSFTKTEALATAGLALGASATAGTAVAQDDEQVVVYEDDYRPNVDFDVVSEIEGEMKVNLIEASGSADDVFDDPDDWDVFVINYDMDTDAPTWGLLFTEEVDLDVGDSESMGEDGVFRNSRLNLVEVGL